MTDDELRQADLSNLTVSRMTPAQRAELRRRYETFIANFGPATAAKLPAGKVKVGKAKAGKAKKWLPARKPG